MGDKFYDKLSALQDPNGILKDDPRRLHDLRQKMSRCISLMFTQPERGGDPFMFALVSPKPHHLVTEVHGKKIETAATDGKVFYWNPDFLESLDERQLGTVIKHEKRHVYLFHCDPSRGRGWDEDLKNIAFDFVVNGGLEADHVRSGRINKFQLFGGPLGEPILLQEMMDWIDGKVEFAPGVLRCYSDPLAIERTADSIYHEMKSRISKSPRRCRKEDGGCDALSLDPKTGLSKNGPGPYPPGCCQKCGAKPKPGGGFGKGLPKTIDTHIQVDGISKSEVMADLMKAADFVRSTQRGTVPGDVESILKELRQPTLSPHDVIVNCFQRRCKDFGDNKDYTRFRRRPSFIWHLNEATGQYEQLQRLYVPRNFDYVPRWVAMLDTSASMSDDDVADTLKECQVVAAMHNSEGWIVPCDTKPHWEHKIPVTTTSDLRRTKVVGRGGTAFTDFFKELPREMGTDFDLVMILTDGFIDDIPITLAPNCEVIWILNRENPAFKPNFGRVIALRPQLKGA